MQGLEHIFGEALAKSNLKADTHRLLVAVSGGADSMVLAYLLGKFGFRPLIAHVNYGLRGKDSLADETLVKDFSEQLGLQCEVFSAQGLLDKRDGASIQMKARELRYNFFKELKKRYSLDYILTAHHRDDQVENFFLALMRKGGARSLSGMTLLRDDVIRPLLGASRAEIQNYALANNIPWREDLSNSSLKYRRNFVRHQLIPPIRNVAPELETNISESCIRLKSQVDLLDFFLKKYRQTCLKSTADGYFLESNAISGMPDPSVALFEILRPFGFSYSICASICANLTSPGRLFKSGEWFLHTERAGFLISKGFVGERMPRKELSGSMLIEQVDFLPDQISVNEAFIDADTLSHELRVRAWKHGDFFYPTGMKGRKLLSDLLNDLKMEKREKEQVLVLTHGPDVVWVVNQRVDRRFAASRDDNNIVRVTFLGKSDG